MWEASYTLRPACKSMRRGAAAAVAPALRAATRSVADGFPESRGPACDEPIGKARGDAGGDEDGRVGEEMMLVAQVPGERPAEQRRKRAIAGVEHPRPDGEGL